MVNALLVGVLVLVLAVAALVVFAAVTARGARRQEASAGHRGVAVSILPGSSPGWWSAGLATAFVLALAAVTVLPGEDLLGSDSNQALALALKIVFIAMSAASFGAGLVSIIRRKELAVIVLMGMLITLWMGLIAMTAHLFME